MDFQTSSALVVVIASIAAYYYQHALHQEQLDSLWIGKVEAAVPVYDYGAADIDELIAKGEPFVVHNWPLGADTSHESFIDTSETVDALIGLDNIFVNFNHEMHEQIVGDVPYDRSKERFRVTGVVQEHMPFKAFISRAERSEKEYLYASWTLKASRSILQHPFSRSVSRRFWMGSQGTAAQLHYDHDHNILLQIRGVKRIELYPRRR